MNKATKIILISAIAIIILLCVGFFAILGTLLGKDPADTSTDTNLGVLPPDHPPMETDPNQESLGGDATIPASTSSGGISISYLPNVTIDLSEKTVSFLYTNTQSNQNAVAMLEINGHLIAESAVINPGNKISVMTLNDEALSLLQPGVYNNECYLVVGLYNMDTGEKSMVDLRFKLKSITVEE